MYQGPCYIDDKRELSREKNNYMGQKATIEKANDNFYLGVLNYLETMVLDSKAAKTP